VKLVAERKLPSPKNISVVEAVLNRSAVGKSFKKDAKAITEYFTNLEQSELEEIDSKLKADG
jgi:glycyl-tRNA synthetase